MRSLLLRLESPITLLQRAQIVLDNGLRIRYNRHMKDLEMMGDALEEVTQAQVFEAMADESELGDADINAWAEMWLAKENA